MTASANRWTQRISLWLWKTSGIWDFDDSNQTDLPSATATLVNGQQDYQIPTSTFKIKRVEVKDINGIWTQLIQLDETEITTALPEFQKTNDIPIYYRIEGASLYLYPKPDTTKVTAAAGIRIYVSREFLGFSVPASYTTADNTEPGFDEQFHDAVAMGIGFDWCLTNGPDERASRLRAELSKYEGDAEEHFDKKNADKKVALKPRTRLYT